MLKILAKAGQPVRTITAATLAAALLGASACSNEAAAPTTAEASGEVSGLTITNARLILNAVKANPAVVYFDLSYTGDKGLSIRKVEVEGAGMTMLHDYAEQDGKMQMVEAMPIGIKNGSQVAFKPGGLHVMAMEPSPAWQPGGTVKVTLTLSGGSTHSFDAEIRAPGDER